MQVADRQSCLSAVIGDSKMRRLLILLLASLATIGIATAQEATSTAATPAPAATATAAPEPAAPEAAAEVASCADCHADQAKAFAANAHFRAPVTAAVAKKASSAANAVCESCHGNGAAHIEGGGDKEKIYKPQGRAGSDTTCLTCHDKNTDRISRHSGMHANSAAVNCLSCHSVHSPDPKSTHLLVKTQLALCSSCHTAQAASFRSKPYGHRLGTGTMECSSCHEVHGRAGKESIKLTSAGEQACASCHSDKRGMFVFPHGANSVGDCTSCHETHGSSNPRQLKRASVSQLCLECHSPMAGVTTIASQPPSFHNISLARFQNCTTCHVTVHGSNRSPQLLK